MKTTVRGKRANVTAELRETQNKQISDNYLHNNTPL